MQRILVTRRDVWMASWMMRYLIVHMYRIADRWEGNEIIA